MKDLAKPKALHQEITAAREAGCLDTVLAQRIHAEATLAAENDPRFLKSFFHVLPPELLKRRNVKLCNTKFVNSRFYTFTKYSLKFFKSRLCRAAEIKPILPSN
jgi:hypothetical protein